MLAVCMHVCNAMRRERARHRCRGEGEPRHADLAPAAAGERAYPSPHTPLRALSPLCCLGDAAHCPHATTPRAPQGEGGQPRPRSCTVSKVVKNELIFFSLANHQRFDPLAPHTSASPRPHSTVGTRLVTLARSADGHPFGILYCAVGARTIGMRHAPPTRPLPARTLIARASRGRAPPPRSAYTY